MYCPFNGPTFQSLWMIWNYVFIRFWNNYILLCYLVAVDLWWSLSQESQCVLRLEICRVEVMSVCSKAEQWQQAAKLLRRCSILDDDGAMGVSFLMGAPHWKTMGFNIKMVEWLGWFGGTWLWKTPHGRLTFNLAVLFTLEHPLESDHPRYADHVHIRRRPCPCKMSCGHDGIFCFFCQHLPAVQWSLITINNDHIFQKCIQSRCYENQNTNVIFLGWDKNLWDSFRYDHELSWYIVPS